MKRVTKFLGVIVLAALVGLSMSACDTDSPARAPGPDINLVGTPGLVFLREPPATVYTVARFEGEESVIIIPATRNGFPVAIIGDSTFEGRELVSVTIGDNITSIGDSAFANNLLESVTIPESVITIGNNAFANNHLTSITIGSGVDILNDL